MRVMQVIGSKEGGGAENFFVRLAQALQEAGETVLAVSPPGSAVATALDRAVAQRPIAMRGQWDLWARWQIDRAMREFRPDIVQTWMGRASRLVHLPPGRRPVHVARLGGYYKLKGYQHAHAWVGNTLGICDYLVREGLPAKRVFHIGNFVEIAEPPPAERRDALRVRYGLPANALVLAAAGRLHVNKGFADLLQAVHLLQAEIGGRPVHLLLAGDGPLLGALQAQARQLKLESRVHWLGWQTDLAPCLSLADVFVCPSRYEPLGNVILEAWAHRVPLVTTASAGAQELVKNGVNGRIVPVAAPAHLTAALFDLLQADRIIRTALVEAGLDTLRTSHSKQAVTAAYVELYERLVGACAA